MNFEDTVEEAAFRTDLRNWLAGHNRSLPEHGDPGRPAALLQWHRDLAAAGFMGLSWPVEYGGQGLSSVYESILNDEVGRAGAPPVPPIGFLGRAIQDFGTEEQKTEYLPGLLTGAVKWSQGFSEPDAGSDLAALSTRAMRHEDYYLLNGQKLWNNSIGATFMLALARTDPHAARHDGLSALIVDLRSPGVEVRPVQQISGDLDFSEVFFTDVRVPVANRIGAEGQGWKLAMSTLAYERGPADIGHVSKLGRILNSLDDAWRAGTLRDVPDAGLRLARAHVEIEVLRLKVLQSLSARQLDGAAPGPEGSVDKLLLIRTEQRLLATLLELTGGSALVQRRGDVLAEYFQSRAASIRGGTEQVQRGIVATRLLGLPGPARRSS